MDPPLRVDKPCHSEAAVPPKNLKVLTKKVILHFIGVFSYWNCIKDPSHSSG